MDSFFVRFKNALVLMAVLLAQTFGLALQVRRPAAPSVGEPDGRQVYLLRLWVNAGVTPVERLVHRVGLTVRGTWSSYLDLRNTREQNRALQQEIATLRLEQAAFAEDAVQGHRLQAMLDFQQHYVAHTLAAQVIGTSGSDLARLLTIDKGAAEGLKPDMAVITPDGVVGKLRDVFPHTAQLLLLNDPTSGAGVLLQSTRIRAIVRGTPTGRLQIGNLTADTRIKPGETVLTSGGDLVYPRGLPVGTIEAVAPDPDHQPYTAIMLKPAANLARLEEVLIITEMQTGLSAQAQQDLAQGVATAETMAVQAQEAKRAADLLAERLPSLHEGNSGTDSTGSTPATENAAAPAETKDPGGAVPRPLPTLHADRFTPGSTAAAAALTPGAKTPVESVPAAAGEAGSEGGAAVVVRRPRKAAITGVPATVPEPLQRVPDSPAPFTPVQEPPR